MNIVFLDFDGPMIPTRAYFLPGQTRPVRLFDPCAVSLINRLCEKAEARIVVHSSWRKVHDPEIPTLDDLKNHMINQGIDEDHLHKDLFCPFKMTSSRWYDIQMWINDHDTLENYVIIEDENIEGQYPQFEPRLVKIEFDEGLTFERYQFALSKFGMKEPLFL